MQWLFDKSIYFKITSIFLPFAYLIFKEFCSRKEIMYFNLWSCALYLNSAKEKEKKPWKQTRKSSGYRWNVRNKKLKWVFEQSKINKQDNKEGRNERNFVSNCILLFCWNLRPTKVLLWLFQEYMYLIGEKWKFWLGDKNFPRGKISPTKLLPDEYFYAMSIFTRRILSNNKNFPGKVTKCHYFPDEYSIQRPDVKVGVNLRGH